MLRNLVCRTSTLVTVFALIRSSPGQPQSLFVAGRAASFVASHIHNRQGTRPASSTARDMSKRVLVPIADGSEEIETTCITDTLVRFGADVTIASVKPNGDLLCTMSRGIKVQADTTIAQAATEEWDLIALPGGMPGAEHLRDSAPLIDLLKKQMAGKKLYGAVCASPAVVLATHNLIPEEGSATCYPAPVFREKITTVESNEDVVINENLTTSQGPGTSLKFALQLGENLFGKEKRDEIAKAMLADKSS